MFNKANKYKITMYFSSALSTATKIESNTQTGRKYAASTALLILSHFSLYVWHLFLLHQQNCSHPQVLNHRKSTEEMKYTGLGGVEMFIRIRRAKLIFSLIFSLGLSCSIYCRHKVFLKLKKILIQQQKYNNICILETQHAKFRNKLCYYC